MSTPYMPNSDSGFRAWLHNFASLLNANAQRYALDPSDGQLLYGLSVQYEEAYNAVQSAATRTPGAIAHKDSIEACARATARTYAGLIRANMGVTNEDRRELGLGIENL